MGELFEQFSDCGAWIRLRFSNGRRLLALCAGPFGGEAILDLLAYGREFLQEVETERCVGNFVRFADMDHGAIGVEETPCREIRRRGLVVYPRLVVFFVTVDPRAEAFVDQPIAPAS